jgi:hypothetical protein
VQEGFIDEKRHKSTAAAVEVIFRGGTACCATEASPHTKCKLAALIIKSKGLG